MERPQRESPLRLPRER